MDERLSFISRLRRFVQSNRGQAVLLGLMLLVLVIDSGRILRSSSPLRSRSDFEDYHEASRRLNHGEDLYRTGALEGIVRLGPDIFQLKIEDLVRLLVESRGIGAYLYPPFFAYLLTPLHNLEYRTAAILFQSLSLASLIAIFFLLYRWLQQIRMNDRLVIAAVLYFPFLDDNISNGNVGFLLLLLCGVGLIWSFREGFVEFAGGFLIGIASVIKIIPAFLSGVLFAGRRFVALAGFLSGILFAVVIPATTIGWHQNVEKHEQWYIFLIETYQKHLVVRPYANNQTVSAALSKLMIAGSDQKQEKFGLPLVSLELSQLQGFSRTVRWMNGTLVGALVVLILAVALRKPLILAPAIAGREWTAMVSLTMLTALVASGVSWYHTYSLLLIPLAMRMGQGGMGRDEQMAFFGPAGLALLLSVLPFRWFEALSLYSLFTWVVLVSVILHHGRLWKGLIGHRVS